jgi:hypothetical protein
MHQESPKHWIEIAKKINSIAQTGLTFTKDPFDKDRYEELLKLSIQIMSNLTKIDSQKLEFVFNREAGLPGGYAEAGMTPGEIAVKEVKEESIDCT